MTGETGTPERSGTRGKDMIDILIEDHREVDELFAELESGAAPRRISSASGRAAPYPRRVLSDLSG